MNLPINQIITGDCLEVMKTFPDKSIDLVLTDPPYGIGESNEKMQVGENWQKQLITVIMIGIKIKLVENIWRRYLE